MLDVGHRDRARLVVVRQKAHRDRIAARRRQDEALSARPIAQQRVRHLDQAAGAVADQRVGPDRAAMVEIDQDLQPASDDVVRFPSLDVDDETDAAGIMLVAGVVEALSFWQCHNECSAAAASRVAPVLSKRRRRRDNMHVAVHESRFNRGG